jgi:hypothetical protein
VSCSRIVWRAHDLSATYWIGGADDAGAEARRACCGNGTSKLVLCYEAFSIDDAGRLRPEATNRDANGAPRRPWGEGSTPAGGGLFLGGFG